MRRRQLWQYHSCAIVALSILGSAAVAADSPLVLSVVVEPAAEGARVSYGCGDAPIAVSAEGNPAGLEVQLKGKPWQGLRFATVKQVDKGWMLGPATVNSLAITLTLKQIAPNLIERSIHVEAAEPTPFRLRWSAAPSHPDGTYCSWMSDLGGPTVLDTMGGVPEYRDVHGETFPVAMWWNGELVLGVLADSPGKWENRCVVDVNPVANRISVATGDGSDLHDLKIVHDAGGGYSCKFDGWQQVKPSHPREFSSWLFVERAKSRYDTRLAAHLALANAKGWNGSALEAMLRNTSYLLLRRNLMRSESKHIFISGIGYGWKQWGTDAFYLAIGLGDPQLLGEAYRGLFETRLTYEDNAQYYLIWSALVKRAGGEFNESLMKVAYDFVRKHEQNGLYIPPPLKNAPNPRAFRTYHDLLEYDDDDSPTSNQGFHCGALMAAQELELGATDADIDRAIAGFQSLFNTDRGFFPTSRKQRDTLGGDALYGETLTYAVFGRKLATDEQVRKHLARSFRVASPYGFRVISQADGTLLPGHGGSYVFGGSWFMCDHATLLSGLIHGLPASEIDQRLIDRVMLEIRHYPAFNESINTVNGEPHGHILYSSNSGYAWIRPEVRKRIGISGPDRVATAIDERLGVVRQDGSLRLTGRTAETR